MPYPLEFKDEYFPPQQVLCIRQTTTLAEASSKVRELADEVADYLRELDVEPTGAPLACYKSIGSVEIDLEVGFPVDRPIAPRGRIKTVRMEGGPAVTATLRRPDIPVTWSEQAIQNRLVKQCSEAVGPLIEVDLSYKEPASRQGWRKFVQCVEQGPPSAQRA
jgi:hypothetical protein